MSKTISTLKYLGLIIITAALGLGIWLFRQTNVVAQVVLDATPLVQVDGITNVAIYGVGGEGHEGADLTDTILVASLRHSDHSVKLLAIPRDIWVESLKIKINSAYHYGNLKGSGEGLKMANQALAEVLGVPIQYSVLIDFTGFIKLVDTVGGVEVSVVNTFDDYKYPIPGLENAEPESSRYEHLHFDAGLQHMDGVTALKFARSRHAEGLEGTDYARGARQQLIISALKDRFFSSKTLLNLKTLTAISDSLKSSVDTDITSVLYRSFFEYGLQFKTNNQNLESGAIVDYLTNPKDLRPYGGAWVLLPTKDLKPYVAKFLAE